MKIGQKVVVSRPSVPSSKGIEGIVLRINPIARTIVIRVTKKSLWGNGALGNEFFVDQYKCDVITRRFGDWIKEMERNGNVKV